MINLRRKVTALLAAAGILFSMVAVSFGAVAESTNFARNPGFESGSASDATSWGLYPEWAEKNIVTSTIENPSIHVHGETRSIKIALSKTQNYALYAGGYTNSDFTLGAGLTLTMWVKYANMTGNFTVGLERKAGDVAVANSFSTPYTGSVTGWTQITHEIPATDTPLDEVVIKVEVSTGAGTLYIDDVSLSYTETDEPVDPVDPVEGELLLNSSFEEGSASEASAWGLSAGWNADRIFPVAKDGSRSVYVETGAQEVNLFQSSNWNSERAYSLQSAKKVTAWVNFANITGNVFLRVERKSGVANVESTRVTGNSGGWMLLELSVPATTKAVDELIVSVVCTAGTGSVMIDLVSMTDDTTVPDPEDPEDPIDPDEPWDGGLLLNGSFEDNSGWGNLETVPEEYSLMRDGVSAKHGKSVAMFEPSLYPIYYLMQSNVWANSIPNLQSGKKFTVWVNYKDITGEIYLQVERKNDKDIGIANVMGEKYRGTSNGWVELSLIVPATDKDIHELIVSVVATNGNGRIYIDCARLVEYVEENPTPVVNELLLNPSFEEGTTDAPGWGLAPAWKAENFTTDAKDGSRAVTLTLGDEDRKVFQSNKWNPEPYNLKTAKKVTAWVKYQNVTGSGIYLAVERKSNDIGVANVSGIPVTGTSDGWVQIELIVPATDKAIDEFIVCIVGGFGKGTVQIDLASMTEYTPPAEGGPDKKPDQPTVTNLLMNGSFEKGSASEVSGWGISTKWSKNVISDIAKDGVRSVKMKQGTDAVNLFQSSEWNPEKYNMKTAKKITAWVKAEKLTGTGVFMIVERKKNNIGVSNISSTAVSESTNGWQQIELIVPATDEKIEEFVLTIVASPGTGTVYVDDVVMTEYTGSTAGITTDGGSTGNDDGALLRNGGLEVLNNDGSIYCWDTWPGDPKEGENHSSVSTTEKHSGKQSLKISLTEKNVQAVYQYALFDERRFDFQEAYVFSMWVKFENVKMADENTIRIGVKRKGADGNYYNSYKKIETLSEDGWQQVSIVVAGEKVEIKQYDVIVELGLGTGDVYLDDFVLTKATEEELATLATSGTGTQKPKIETKVVSTGTDTAQTDNNARTVLLTGVIALAVLASGSSSSAVLFMLRLRRAAG